MPIVTWAKDETAAILTMNNGENRQNLDFANAMNAVLDEILSDASVHAIVLTSSDEKNFSQGVDVQWIMTRMQAKETQAIKDFLYGMNGVFKRLLTAPVPVIAAINGHAYGNGAMLSCACDFRFMKSDRGFFCFPEVNIGIPFLYGMNAFVKKAIPYHKFIEMQFTGNRYAAPELERHNIIVKACANAEELMKESISFAKTFVKKRGIFGEMKKRMYRDILEIMDSVDPNETIEPLKIFIPD